MCVAITCCGGGGCSSAPLTPQNGHPGSLWSDPVSGRQALLDALDVLVKRSSWRDSIVALLMWPVLWSLRHVGASWLWLWARQGLGLRWGQAPASGDACQCLSLTALCRHTTGRVDSSEAKGRGAAAER